VANALTGVRTRTAPSTTTRTAQTVRAHQDEIRNAAGGMVFGISDEARLHRFLTMGTDGGTFYTSERALTRENAQVVIRAATSAPLMLVRAIREVSEAGRAPRQDPAIFALAIAASLSDDAGRKAALDALPAVCRTASTLFTFLKYAEQFRGWGRGLRKAVGRWYDDKDLDKLALQVIKYRAREGWEHIDGLRLASDRGPKGDYTATFDADHALLYNYLAGRTTLDRKGAPMAGELPEIVLAYEALKRADTKAAVLDLLDVDGITWEMIPDAFINEAEVWEKLIHKGLPITAAIRQLPRLTRIGISPSARAVLAVKLTDPEALKRGRVHPINILVAQKTYAQGRSERGESTWTPWRIFTDALDAAFYASFGAITPAGKSELVGIDCSGSMSFGASKGSGVPLSCVEICAAVAMVTAATEPAAEFVAFDTRAWRLDGISSRRRLDDNVAYLKSQIQGGTDVSQPIQYAIANRVHVDTIKILTDGETWAGRMHPFEAMKVYRQRVNPKARLAVVAMTASGRSIAAPFDELALDVSGFDSSVPQILADFSGGKI
jgi:60 kDa SS-A/Ro ribonucleoprotein